MPYDFSTLQSRAKAHSSKWESMYSANPNTPSDIVPFSAADMELKNPPEIASGVSEYLKNTIMGYTSVPDSYYDAVVSWAKRRHHWNIEKDWILTYPGVIPAMYHAICACTNPGDGVIIFTPVYFPFYKAVEHSGRKMIQSALLNKGDHYEIDFEDFARKAKQSDTTMLLLCSPHNPVGRVWTREELARLSEICLENNVLIVADEIHHDLILPGYHHTVLSMISEEVAQKSIILTAPTKTFNIAGMKVSNAVIQNPELKKKMADFRFQNFVFDCNMAGYKAAEIAYNECEQWLDELLNLLDANKQLLNNFFHEKFSQLQVYELEGTYLQWIDCRNLGMDYKELERFLQQEAYLFTDEGYMFGKDGEGFERINIACPTHVLETALNRFYDAWMKRQKR